MAELSVQIKLQAFDEVSDRFANIIEAGSRLSAQFDDNRERLQALNAQARRLQAFDTLRQKVANTGQSLNEARERVQRLHRELQRGSAGRSAREMSRLRQQYQQAKNTASSLERTHARQRERLSSLNGELRRAGINTRQLSSEQQRLNASSQSLIATMERQANRLRARAELGERLNHARDAHNRRMERANAIGDAGQRVSMAGAVVVGAVSMGVKGLIDTASQFERFEAILQTTEGSSQGARKALDWVSEFAAKTPYEISEVTDAFVQMRAYGLDPTNGLLMTLGDTASAMGKDLSQAVEAIADAVTGENERLKELGITASKNQKTGNFEYSYTDKNGIQQMKTANAQSRAEIEKVITEIWSEKYAGGMENLSKTFEGQMGKLKDIWVQFKLAIMKNGLFEDMKERLGRVSEAIEKMKKTGEFDAWAKNIAAGLKVVFDVLWQMGVIFAKVLAAVGKFANKHPALTQFIAKFMAIGAIALVVLGPIMLVVSLMMKFGSVILLVGKSLGALKTFAKTDGDFSKGAAVFGRIAKAVGMLGAALKTVGMALMTNPIFLAIALLAGLAYVIYANWDTLKPFFINLWNTISAGVLGLWASMVAIWNNIVGTVSSFALTLWANLKMYFFAGIQALIMVITSFSPVGLFMSAFGAVLSYLSGLVGQFTAYGANLIDGLKNGIMSRVEAVVGAITRVVSRIKSAFTGAKGMDIHSPSRVFKAYGGYMMQGLDQGLMGNAKNVINTTQGLTGKIKDSMANITPNHTNITGAVAGGQGYMGAGATPANIVININGATDPQAVARAVQSELARVQASQSARDRRRMMD